MQLYVVPDGFCARGVCAARGCRRRSTIELPESGIVATDNAAKILGFAVGDEVELRTSALDEEVLTVEAVTVNYLGNAVYMTQEAYEKAFGAAYEPNALLVQLSGDAAAQVSFADELGADDTYLSITSIEKMRGDFSSAFALINGIVYLVIVLAAGLAFVVLFTLSTTNISERERELATLKVLGFRRGEVRRYVNKETMVLTLLGVAFGLPAGWLLSYSFRFLLKPARHQLRDLREPLDLPHRHGDHAGVRVPGEPGDQPHARPHRHGRGAQEPGVGEAACRHVAGRRSGGRFTPGGSAPRATPAPPRASRCAR